MSKKTVVCDSLPKATKPKKINVKRQAFIKGVIEGKKVSKAALDAGYSPITSRYKSGTMLKEEAPNIIALMEKRGLTDDRLLDVLQRGLEASKVISCNVIAPNGEGMKDANSMTKDFIDVPDYAVQHKFLDTALKVKGHLRDKMEVTGPNGKPIEGRLEVVFVGSDADKDT